MKFWQRYWYYIGGVAFVILAFAMGLWGSAALDYVQVLLIFSWMGMLVHQFEEYAWPGGFPLISNMIVFNEIERPDRYILNQRQCFVSNVVLCYLCYIVPIFFPQLIWLAAAQIFQGLWQIPAHGIVLNMRLKSVYNPGLFAAVFLQLPVAIVFIWCVLTFMPEAANQLWWGIPGSLVLLGISFGLPILFMHDRDSKDPFEERELWGYKREYVAKVWEERKAAAAADPGSVPKGLFQSEESEVSGSKWRNFAKKPDRWCDNQIVFLRVTATVAVPPPLLGSPLGSKAGVFVAFIMAFHVLEEWKFPGGLHWFYNTSVFRPKDESLYDPTRYPMSRLTDMVTNVGLQWIPLVYAALCFFLPLSNAVALCVILLCVMELFAHTAGGVATYLWYRDKGKKTIYHTGLATSLMMFLPAAAYLIAHIAGVTATDWLWCLVLFAVMCCVCVPLTETPLKKWVRKQEPGMFAFEDAKYLCYGGYCKEDVEQSEARVD
ncbi:MAG: HXXEE domain-containing protein [Eggerthella lenta]